MHVPSLDLYSLRNGNVQLRSQIHNLYPVNLQRTDVTVLLRTFLCRRSFCLKKKQHMYHHLTVQRHVLLHRVSGQNRFLLLHFPVFLQIPAWYMAYSQLLFVQVLSDPSEPLSSLKIPCLPFSRWLQTSSSPDSVSVHPAERRTFRFRNLFPLQVRFQEVLLL